MGFKVNYKGLEVICETIDDIDKLADRYNKGVSKKTNTVNAGNDRNASLFDSKDESDLLPKSLIHSFSENAKRLLMELVKAGKALSDDEIAERMGAQKTSVAGYISDIALKSQKAGFDYSKFFVRIQLNDKQGEREYSNEVPQSVRDGLLKTLKS
jgi:hypothetical protein